VQRPLSAHARCQPVRRHLQPTLQSDPDHSGHSLRIHRGGVAPGGICCHGASRADATDVRARLGPALR